MLETINEDELVNEKEYREEILNLNFVQKNEESFKEYIAYKKVLKNTNKRNFIGHICRSRLKIFDRQSDMSEMESILLSNDDKSAIISLILRNLNLWNSEKFWCETIDLAKIMKHYAQNENANLKNLFSILMHDWHNPPYKKCFEYLLKMKFDMFDSFGQSLFKKFCEIIDDEEKKEFNDICLRIIHYYYGERQILLKSYTFDDEDEDSFQASIISNIKETLMMQNFRYKVKLLKILVFFWNGIIDENYNVIKMEIIQAVDFTFEYESLYKTPLKHIEHTCNKYFFELAFLLKENYPKKFESKFNDYILIYKRFYGEYWKVAMKTNARLLYQIAESLHFAKIVEFIFHNCTFIALNSTILTDFEESAEFNVIFNEPLDKKDEDFLRILEQFAESEIDEYEENQFEMVFKNTRKNRKLLFGRRSGKDMNIFEKILSNSSAYNLIDFIYNEFHLWLKPELLSLANPMGNYLLYYAIQSENDDLLIKFMMPKVTEKHELFSKQKYYMQLQNAQYCSITGKCLIEYHLDIILENRELEQENLFGHLVYLLEEIGIVNELREDSVVDLLIELTQQGDIHDQNVFEIDDILGNIIVFWQPGGEFYKHYKTQLIKVCPFYELLFMIIEKDENFEKIFHEKINELEESYETRYRIERKQELLSRKTDDRETYETYSTNLLFIIFLAAMKTNQRSKIDFIFNYDAFDTIQFGFSENIKVKEIHYYIALNMLKRRHELGRAKIPDEWLTHEVLEEFFDSRITFRDQELIEIDCSCMLHSETQKIRVKTASDVTDKLLFWEDTRALEFITDRENLRNLLMHPVVETYINLKNLKYKRIFMYNFWAFVILFILPFISLFVYNHPKKDEYEDEYENEEHNENNLNILRKIFINDKWHYIGIIFLISRETFQFMISDNWKAHCRKKSNIIEMILIALSIWLSICNATGDLKSFTISEVSFIFFGTISATSILPFAHVPINMEILRKVALTFLRIFYTFAIILIAFSFSFYIMFEQQKSIISNSTSDDSDDEPGKNFRSPTVSLVKILLMLTGEFSIEPSSLEAIQLILFIFFVVTSLILFNLILGLSIEDVSELKNTSRQFDLLTKTIKLIDVGHKMERYYKKHRQAKKFRNSNGTKVSNFIGKIKSIIFLSIIRFFLSKYIYLHSIKKIYVNVRTKEASIYVNGKPVSILKKSSRYSFSETYKITNVTFKEIQSIISDVKRETFTNLMEKMKEEEKTD